MVPDPNDISESDEQVLISEGQRRLSLIESRSERYQRQSALLLRISLATIGVIAAFGDFKAILSFLDRLAKNIEPSATVQAISSANTQTSPILATLEVFALSVQGMVGAILAITFTFSTVVFAGLVVYPQDEGMPISFQNLGDYFENPEEAPQECIRRHYDDLVLLNQAALEESRTQLKHSFLSIVGAVIGSAVAIFSVLVLAFAGPRLVQTAGVLSAGMLAMGLISIFLIARANEEYRPVVKWSHETETGLIMAFIVVAVLLYFPMLGNLKIFDYPIILLLPFIPPLWGIRRTETERIRIGFKGVAWHIILLSSLGGLMIVYPGDITNVIPSSLITVVFFSSFFPLGFMVELLGISLFLIMVDIFGSRYPSVYKQLQSRIPSRLTE